MATKKKTKKAKKPAQRIDTVEKFLELFRERCKRANKPWTLYQGKMLRADSCCPISVCAKRKPVCAGEYLKAVAQFGMPLSLSGEIVAAADGFKGHSTNLRGQLLKIAGVKK